MKNTSNGFVLLFKETKEAAKLIFKQSSKSSSLLKSVTRAEIEFLRSNRESVKKMTGFFFLQLVPVLGYVPIVVGLLYPRQVFTHHFWSDEQKLVFLSEEFEERRQYCVDLARELNFHSIQSSKDCLSLFRSQVQSIPQERLALKRLSSAHLTALAGAVGVCSNKAVLVLSPNILLRYWLSKRAQEIAEDDRYIWNNMTTTDLLVTVDKAPLSLLEQIEFCRRRGFDCSSLLTLELTATPTATPSSPPPSITTITGDNVISRVPPQNEVIRPERLALDACIREWVSSTSDLVKGSDPKESGDLKDHHVQRAAIILHLIALNAAVKK